MKKYIPKEFESKWQKKWEENGLYKVDDCSSKPKKYILDMFPYPSGDGLHVGHFKGYTATDILSRYFCFQGFNVLHPMGWDAFGLPAENYALKTGVHPAVSTAQNIGNIKRQMQMVGLSYDWDREINTTDPEYYKWTQWIFIKLFEKGLAYEDEAPINWCPSCKTGLANEEVLNGECERCGTLVEQKEIRQWMLKITEYADKLVAGLEGLDWPQAIKEMQINWIGKSEGALIKFIVHGSQLVRRTTNDKRLTINVFTTRPDTLFGATFIIISPEHQLLNELVKPQNKAEVEKYIANAKAKSELERKENEASFSLESDKEKTGVFTGSYVKNPLTEEKIPVWVADYVLMGYGTGAIMAVPAHDQRDFEFAKKYDLPIKPVIAKIASPVARNDKESAYEGDGILINSGEFDGLSSNRAKEKITKYLEEHQLGLKQVQYHLRDWVFSRQRYWGEPIPLVHCDQCGIVAIPKKDLPLKLPEVEKYEPTGTGESPLAAINEWVNTSCPKCGGPAKRETNTMPQWAGSCWYYLRFCDPKNNQELISKKNDKYWMPVDWYVGGAEHAVLHLLYARFWHKFLFDLGIVTTPEPFQKLTIVGLILASDGRKMGKRWGNVITTDEIIKEYGADTLRIYEAFMGPFENIISWDPTSIYGVFRFLNRVWGLQEKVESSGKKSRLSILATGDLRIMHQTIKKVTDDIEALKLNTAVASLMEWLNYLSRKKVVSREEYKVFLLLLAPFAPFITEELWQMVKSSVVSRQSSDKAKDSLIADSEAILKADDWSIHQQSWSKYDEKYLEEDQITIVVQVNGRVRENFTIQKDILNNREVIEDMAIKLPNIQKYLKNRQPLKTIYVPGKILNLVIPS